MIAPPSDMPELTKPNTLPICPGGAASLTITSRGVFLAPVIRPPTNNTPIVAGSGSETTPTSSNTAAAPIVRATTKGAAVGHPTTDEHAADLADHVPGQRRRSGRQRQPMHLVQDRDQPGLDTGAGHRRHHEERKKHQHRSAQQQPGPAFCRAVRRATRLIDQDSALPDNRRHDRKTKEPN